ncbi:MAG: metallophosphoesterase [Desulfuromonas sp.]|nr:MAG: metallophosphoesterase [Desulfuromonas sp.]
MIAVISDVHGNFPALEAVLGEIDNFGCQRIVSLGDVAGYYCYINECIDILREKNVQNVLGNHDFYLVCNEKCPRSNSANLLLESQRKIIRADNLEWLRRSVATFRIDAASFVHGGWDDPLDEYMLDVNEEYFQNRGSRYYFSGHTHIQTLKIFNNALYCNPGSVGQPRDGDPRAAFALYDGQNVFLKRVDYDIDRVASKMQEYGYDDYFYKGLYTGDKIGHQV